MTVRMISLRALAITVVIVATSHQPAAGVQNPAGAPPTSMTLEVDASDAPMKILHATMSMPARAGAMALFYPKWIPGEHMASGPIANLTGLHVFADGREID
jgi:hypothetical protein